MESIKLRHIAKVKEIITILKDEFKINFTGLIPKATFNGQTEFLHVIFTEYEIRSDKRFSAYMKAIVEEYNLKMISCYLSDAGAKKLREEGKCILVKGL